MIPLVQHIFWNYFFSVKFCWGGCSRDSQHIKRQQSEYFHSNHCWYIDNPFFQIQVVIIPCSTWVILLCPLYYINTDAHFLPQGLLCYLHMSLILLFFINCTMWSPWMGNKTPQGDKNMLAWNIIISSNRIIWSELVYFIFYWLWQPSHGKK